MLATLYVYLSSISSSENGTTISPVGMSLFHGIHFFSSCMYFGFFTTKGIVRANVNISGITVLSSYNGSLNNRDGA